MADGPIENREARGTYKGPLPLLKGEKASLVIYPSSGRCMARFDRLETGYGLAAHDFATEHFDLEPTNDPS